MVGGLICANMKFVIGIVQYYIFTTPEKTILQLKNITVTFTSFCVMYNGKFMTDYFVCHPA
jgi:hypothetical protein